MSKINVEARPCNHCCSGKAFSIIHVYSECVYSLTSSACNVHLLRYISICGLYCCTMLCLFTMHCSLRLIMRSQLDVLTFATRCLHACHHAKAPSGGKWNCGRENFLYHTFPHYHINVTIFGGKQFYCTQIVWFDLLWSFVQKYSHSKKNRVRYYHKSLCKISVTFVRF
jgi:hypothetical protein